MTFCTEMADACRRAGVARSTGYETLKRYFDGGLDDVREVKAGRSRYKVTDDICVRLIELLGQDPQQFGWSRSRWSSELMAKQIRKEFKVSIHPSWIRRLLPRLGAVYRRPAPFIRRLDPRKRQKLRAIRRLIRRLRRNEVAVYEDEADINLLPRMGAAWTLRGHQPQVGTPGKNVKRYVAAAINAKDGEVIWVEERRKNTELFVSLLEKLDSKHHRAKRIYVIADNYIIHKCKKLDRLLKRVGLTDKIRTVLLPTYSPKHNPVERLWKCLHDTVTRNHKHLTVDELMIAVRSFMRAASPFPGAGHATCRTRLRWAVSEI